MWQQILISLLPGLISLLGGKNSDGKSNLIDLFGSGFQTMLNYQSQRENQAWQRDFAMQQFNYNSMLNDRSFFHSLPASQVQKFVQAGLSPDLLYGQLSSMDYGNTQSLQQPNAPAPIFSGLENANLLKDLEKKDSEVSLNLSEEQINKIDYALKQLEEAYQEGTLQNRIDLVFLEKQFKQITNQLQESNVETNVINNMKLAAAFGLVRTIEDGKIIYNTTPKFKEIAEFYLSDLRQKYNIQEADYQKSLKQIQKIGVEIQALNSDILINSVAYQQEVLNLISTAIGSGVNLKNVDGIWVVDYDGDSGDVAGVVTLGLIKSVLSAVGIKFSFGKNASQVLGKHESKINSNSVNRNINQNID